MGTRLPARAWNQLLLAEVKGPVMDRLAGTPLGQQRLQERVFLSVHDALAHARDQAFEAAAGSSRKPRQAEPTA